MAASAALVLMPAAAVAASGLVEAGSVSDSTDLSGATATTVSGHYAFVASAHLGQLTAVDISNPANPAVAGFTTTGTPAANALTNASNVAILGNFAYVTSKNRNVGTTSNDDGTGNSLTVVDISTPSAPVAKGFLPDTNSTFGAYGIAVAFDPSSGHTYAYVAAQGLLKGQPTSPLTSSGAFDVVDVTVPTSPTIVATLSNDSLPVGWTGTNALQHITSVAISGHYAYVTAAYSNRLTVIDISTPSSPTIVASLQDGTNLGFDVDVAIQGNYAYVANQGGGGTSNTGSTIPGLAVVDISNPLAPHIVGTDLSGFLNTSYRIRVHGIMVYLATFHSDNAVAVDVADPTSPHVVGALFDPAHFNDTTGVDVDPTLHYMVVTSPQLSTDTGSTIHGTLSVITLDPTQPMGIGIYGKPTDPTTQTSATFLYFTTDTVANIECSLDGAPLAGCNSGTKQYSGLALGTHTFTIQATDAAGNVVTRNFSWRIVSPVVNLTSPSVAGSARQGSTLTASDGSWSGYPTPTLTLQWEDCDQAGAHCVPIAGATSSTHTLTSADVGRTIRIAVTGNSISGSKVVTSAATAMVAPSVSLNQLKAALAHQLGAPRGKLGKIGALLKKGGYQLQFSVLEPGVVQIAWYYLPSHSRLVISHGLVVPKGAKRKGPQPVLVATVRLTFGSAQKARITIKLTPAGKRLLKHSRKLKLTAAGTFTLRGGSPFSKLQPFTLSR